MTFQQLRADDRGLLYGDGLFTTLAVIQRQPQHWQRHWQRLADGCQRLKIPVPEQQDIEHRLSQVCAELEPQAVVKIIITRGAGGRGYRPPEQAQPHVFFSQHPWPVYPDAFFQHGVKLRLCQTRLAQQPLLAGIKHLNRLENVLARSEWDTPEIAEGLMLDTQGNLIEGTMSNVFFVKQGVLCTPSLQQCGVAGIMRGLILATAQAEKIPCKIAEFSLNDLYAAKEVFLSNSLIGIWSVRCLLEGETLVQQWHDKQFSRYFSRHLLTGLL